MQQLKVSFFNQSDDSIKSIVTVLDSLEKHILNYTPWSSYPYKPDVKFAIAHNNNFIFLKYYVTEKSIRAAAGHINGNVWEDACVEFFVSFDNEGYYNLEFNCIGTGLIGFGKEKPTRQRLPDEIIRQVKYQAIINNEENGIHWELTLVIPVGVFAHHQLHSLSGTECRANFYKCGDALPQAHFVAWSNIEVPQPNFHLPEFFGTLTFE
ncbi:MAG: carbohydrate-binding family 9-like protein [Flavisolibacter sp.]|jgi:hypothetical protein